MGSSRFMFAEYRELFQDKIRKTDLALALEFRCHAQLETSLQFGMTDRGGGGGGGGGGRVAYLLHLNSVTG